MVDFSIRPIGPNGLNAAQGTASVVKTEHADQSFGSILNESIQTVAGLQKEADMRASQLAAGESKDIHGTMVAMQKAEIGMSLMMEVRNKLMTAFDEIKRMQF